MFKKYILYRTHNTFSLFPGTTSAIITQNVNFYRANRMILMKSRCFWSPLWQHTNSTPAINTANNNKQQTKNNNNNKNIDKKYKKYYLNTMFRKYIQNILSFWGHHKCDNHTKRVLLPSQSNDTDEESVFLVTTVAAHQQHTYNQHHQQQQTTNKKQQQQKY